GRMPPSIVVRPVVRSFPARLIHEAAAHVRRGGHAVLWGRAKKRKRAWLLFPVPKEDDPHDLSYFAVLDLGKQRFRSAQRGPGKGLATTLVPPDCHDIVRRRAERDKPHRGATRRLELDCTTCAACCRSNRVELDRDDIERFEGGGRADLARAPYARRSDGKLVLSLTSSRTCVHLRADERCGIYSLRPEMCRVFPEGSECCLSARAEEFDLHDGARPVE
ncbi:MAG TPA: YkgJ family cysteine cluster protein, partial [Polyangiaceae bacterium]|nr:YkgJ family cysteine cluster protein [Polyangiaceae bacterium]